MYLNQFYTMYTCYNRLFESYRTQIIENFNEIIIMLTIYHMFCFTDFVPNGETRAMFVGISMLMMTVINMLVNLVPVGIEALIHLKTTSKQKHAKMKGKHANLKRYLS